MAGIIVELIAVFLVFCAALWFGAAWPYLLFPVYLGLLSLKITPVGKKLTVSWVFLLSCAFGLAIALAVGYVAFDLFSTWTVDNPDSSLIQFFLGPAVLRLFWSMALGVMVGLELLALALIPLARLSAQGRLGDLETFQKHKWLGTRTALFGLLGLSQGTLEVREGKVVAASGNRETGLARFGGPGELIVQQGHAVMLETNGRVTRVVGSGLTYLRPFERVSMVVPLTSLAERVSLSNVMTKDKIILDAFECWVFHKLDPGPEELQVQDGLFCYNEQILREKVWKASGKDWRETIQGISTRCIRHVIGDTSFETILAMSDSEREKFNERLRDRINKLTTRSLGVTIQGVDADAIRIPDAVASQLLAVQMGAWAIKIAENRNAELNEKSKGEAAYLTTLEGARARAQSRMIQAILDGFENAKIPPRPDVIRDLRYIEALEKIADDTTTKVMFPFGASLSDAE